MEYIIQSEINFPFFYLANISSKCIINYLFQTLSLLNFSYCLQFYKGKYGKYLNNYYNLLKRSNFVFLGKCNKKEIQIKNSISRKV